LCPERVFQNLTKFLTLDLIHSRSNVTVLKNGNIVQSYLENLVVTFFGVESRPRSNVTVLQIGFLLRDCMEDLLGRLPFPERESL